jgi:hypothetical protein
VEALLGHPAVPYGAAPFAAALVLALLLQPLRLAGLAVAAGFSATLYLAGRLDLHDRMLVVAAAAPLLGALIDLALRPTRATGVLLGLAFGAAAFWVHLGTLGREPPMQLVLFALGIAALTALVVACTMLSSAEPAPAGAAGFGLGAAIAVGSWIYTWRFDLLGFSLAAACGGFLLVGRFPGAAFTLTTGVVAGLLASGAVLHGRLPWYAAYALVLVPLGARLSPRKPVSLVYALAAAGAVCGIAWLVRRGI